MALAHNPRIVTDNLVFCVDAANPRSYPGSGTTWTDLSGNGINGALTNGPLYSANNNGSIVFDGSNDGVEFPGNAALSVNEMTISTWSYSTNYDQNGFLFEKTTNGTVNTQYSLFFNDVNASIYYRTYGLSNRDMIVSLSTAGVTNSSWNNVIATYNGSQKKIYVNGILKSTQSASGTVTQNSTGESFIGIYAGFLNYGFNGNISNVSVYNRALSDTEILQNYNALKGRYGL
jgi:hypothetical protein